MPVVFRDPEGYTVLHTCIDGYHEHKSEDMHAVLKALIAAGADVNLKGATIGRRCIVRSRAEILRLFVFCRTPVPIRRSAPRSIITKVPKTTRSVCASLKQARSSRRIVKQNDRRETRCAYLHGFASAATYLRRNTAPETSRARSRTAPPSFPDLMIHFPVAVCPVMIPTWFGQTTMAPTPGELA